MQAMLTNGVGCTMLAQSTILLKKKKKYIKIEVWEGDYLPALPRCTLRTAIGMALCYV